jgi:hypothetical protein
LRIREKVAGALQVGGIGDPEFGAEDNGARLFDEVGRAVKAAYGGVEGDRAVAVRHVGVADVVDFAIVAIERSEIGGRVRRGKGRHNWAMKRVKEGGNEHTNGQNFQKCGVSLVWPNTNCRVGKR